MKQFLFTLAAAVVAVTASAQVYLGGEVGFWRNYDQNHTNFNITPEVGYNLDENWAIGTTLGYDYQYLDGIKVNSFVVAPYARYTFVKFDNVSLFLDGGFGFATSKAKYEGHSSDSYNSWEVGVKPGVKVDLTSKLSFIAHFGFFGYRDNDDVKVADEDTDVPAGAFGEKGFGFKANGNNLQFGLYYNF